jgi:squalene synthase HpnC
VSIESGRSLEGDFDAPGRLATQGSGRPPRGDFDAPDQLVTKARKENFPVASHLLPSDVRSDLMAIYGFARLTDDLGDQAEGDRLELLDWLEAELESAAAAKASHLVFRQLTPVIRRLDLDLDPFRSLIEANRMDQRVKRYQSFGDLVDYCMLSAAPVGRLVLAVFGVSTPERIALSDKVCIGLQVVEHLQDIGEDAKQDRIYMPADDMEQFGCTEGELLANEASPALRRLVAMEVTRTRGLLAAAAPLAASLRFRPRAAVVGFAAGGSAALDSIERAGDDVLKHRCRPGKLAFATRAASLFVASSVKRRRS